MLDNKDVCVQLARDSEVMSQRWVMHDALRAKNLTFSSLPSLPQQGTLLIPEPGCHNERNGIGGHAMLAGGPEKLPTKRRMHRCTVPCSSSNLGKVGFTVAVDWVALLCAAGRTTAASILGRRRWYL